MAPPGLRRGALVSHSLAMRMTLTSSALVLILGTTSVGWAQQQTQQQPPPQQQQQQQAPQQPPPQQPPQGYPQQPYPQQYPQPYPPQPYPQQGYPQQPYPQQQPQPYPPQQPQPYPPQQPQPYPPQPYPPQPYPPQQPYPPPQYPPGGYGAYPSAPGYQMPQEPARIRRRGFALGFGIGGGTLRVADESHGGFAFNLAIGGMLNERMALLFEYSTLSRAISEFEQESFSSFGGSMQFFLARILWIKAGLGLGRWAYTDDYYGIEDSSELALSGTAAVGVEVLQTTSGFALDLQLRFVGSRFKDPLSPTGNKIGVSQTSLMLGFNFY